jgi:hypothetical protein
MDFRYHFLMLDRMSLVLSLFPPSWHRHPPVQGFTLTGSWISTVLYLPFNHQRARCRCLTRLQARPPVQTLRLSLFRHKSLGRLWTSEMIWNYFPSLNLKHNIRCTTPSTKHPPPHFCIDKTASSNSFKSNHCHSSLDAKPSHVSVKTRSECIFICRYNKSIILRNFV